MSTYHCNVTKIQRSKGRSSVFAAAYICRQKMREEGLGIVYDPQRSKKDLLFERMVYPPWLHDNGQDPECFFNAVELYEKSRNACTAKSIIVALPREFNDELKIRVVEDFVSNMFAELGYVSLYAIHDKHDGNPHAHILVAARPFDWYGNVEQKEKKEYVLDENGDRIPVLDENGIQKRDSRNRLQWKRVTVWRNEIDKKDFLLDLRKAWAEECNLYLEPEHQIDHRSYEEQGIDFLPTIHEGYSARNMEKKGFESERCRENRERKAYNEETERLMQEKVNEAQKAEENQLMLNNIRIIQEWLEETDFAQRIINKLLPPFEGKEELEALRRQMGEMKDREAWEAIWNSERYRALCNFEKRVERMTNAVEFGMRHGYSDEQMLEYINNALKSEKSRISAREDTGPER